MKIYVASSWRNVTYPSVVTALRGEGHEVYDFREPVPGKTGFSWSVLDTLWKAWSPGLFRIHLEDPRAKRAYQRDMNALREADAVVLVLPCGKSAHLEAGWAVGASKPVVVLLAEGEPELMYRMMVDTAPTSAYSHLCLNLQEVRVALRVLASEVAVVSPDPTPPVHTPSLPQPDPWDNLPQAAEDALERIADPEIRRRARLIASSLPR